VVSIDIFDIAVIDLFLLFLLLFAYITVFGKEVDKYSHEFHSLIEKE